MAPLALATHIVYAHQFRSVHSRGRAKCWCCLFGLGRIDLSLYRMANPSLRPRLAARPSSNRLDNPYDVLERGLDATVVEAMRNGVSRILLIAPPPEFLWYAPYCVMQSIRAHVDFCTIARERVEDRRRRTMVVLQEVADRYKAIRIIDPIDLFCTQTECRPNDGRKLYFNDTAHLSPAGIDYLERAFRQQFLWAAATEVWSAS